MDTYGQCIDLTWHNTMIKALSINDRQNGKKIVYCRDNVSITYGKNNLSVTAVCASWTVSFMVVFFISKFNI